MAPCETASFACWASSYGHDGDGSDCRVVVVSFCADLANTRDLMTWHSRFVGVHHL